MTNPDLPQILTFNLGSLTEQQLVDAAVAAVQLRIPEWSPLEGNTEVVLIEAFAVLTNWYQYSLNQVPPAVLDGVVRLFGIDRKPGAQATATVTVTVPSSVTGTKALPAGTRWRVPVGDGTTVDLLTVGTVTVNLSDSHTFTAYVQADEIGARPNGITSGTAAALVEPTLGWVESAVLGSALAGGAAPEDDGVFYPRAAVQLQASNTGLVIPAHFTAAALNNALIGRALTVNNWDGTGSTGTDYGHVTVAVTSPGGIAPASGDLTALQTDLTARAVGGVTVHVQAANIINYTAAVTVDAQPGVDHTALQTSLQAYLRDWVHPLHWPWGGVLVGNELIAKAGTYPGVARVTAVSGASVGAAVTNPTTLPQVNSSVTVTVNA